MKTHPKYEFVFEKSKISVIGTSVENVFNNLPEEFTLKGLTTKTQGKNVFEHFGVDAPLPDVNNKDTFYEEFFTILQDLLIGTWKWYDNFWNEKHWRYSIIKNDVVRRTGPGNRDKSEARKEYSRKNLAKANKVRFSDPVKLHEQAVKAGKISYEKRSSSEEGKEKIRIHGKQLGKANKGKLLNLTAEEKAQRNLKFSTAKRKIELKDNPDMQIIRIEDFMQTDNPKTTNILPLFIGRYTFLRKNSEHDVDVLICRSNPEDSWEYCTCRQAQHYIRRSFLKDEKNLKEFGALFTGKVYIEKDN